MIIYDKTYKLSAIGDAALRILGFSSAVEFLGAHRDLGELVPGFEGQSLIETVLNSPNSSATLNLMTKNKQLISVVANAQTINFIDGQKMYELSILPQNATIELDEDSQSSCALTRLPMIQAMGTQTNKVRRQNLLDEKWFEASCRFLNLNYVEFLSYLQALLNGMNRQAGLLQNAIIAQDKLALKKITALIKEPAMNLKVAPLVKICDAMLEASKDDLAVLMDEFSQCARNIDELIRKYQGDE